MPIIDNYRQYLANSSVISAISVWDIATKKMHQRYFFDASLKFVCILTWSLLVCISSMLLSMEIYSS